MNDTRHTITYTAYRQKYLNVLSWETLTSRDILKSMHFERFFKTEHSKSLIPLLPLVLQISHKFFWSIFRRKTLSPSRVFLNTDNEEKDCAACPENVFQLKYIARATRISKSGSCTGLSNGAFAGCCCAETSCRRRCTSVCDRTRAARGRWGATAWSSRRRTACKGMAWSSATDGRWTWDSSSRNSSDGSSDGRTA